MSSKKQRLEEELGDGEAVRDPVMKDVLFLDEEYLEQQDETSSDPLNAAINYDPELSISGTSDAETKNQLHEGFAQDKLPPGLYGCWLLVAVRNFKGHTSGKGWGVAGDSVDELIRNC